MGFWGPPGFRGWVGSRLQAQRPPPGLAPCHLLGLFDNATPGPATRGFAASPPRAISETQQEGDGVSPLLGYAFAANYL